MAALRDEIAEHVLDTNRDIALALTNARLDAPALGDLVLEFGVAPVDLLEHRVERVREFAHLILGVLLRAQRIAAASGDAMRRLRERLGQPELLVRLDEVRLHSSS